MLEPINCSKVLKVWWEWLSVIGEYLIWNAVSGEVGFRLVDYLLGCLACQPVNLEVVWVVINGDKKISVVQLEQVHADFLPWSCRYVVADHWLFSLLWLVTVAGAALGYVVFYFLVHARPVQYRVSLALLGQPWMPMWLEWSFSVISSRNDVGTTSLSPLKISPFCIVSSSLKGK